MAYMGYGGSPEYVARVADTVVALMIEKRGAVEALDEILVLPGVDLIQFGRGRLLAQHRSGRGVERRRDHRRFGTT